MGPSSIQGSPSSVLSVSQSSLRRSHSPCCFGDNCDSWFKMGREVNCEKVIFFSDFGDDTGILFFGLCIGGGTCVDVG